MNKNERLAITISSLLIFILLATTLYFWYLSHTQKSKINSLMEDRNIFLLENSSTTKAWAVEREQASSTIAELSSRLHLTSEELEDIEHDLRREKNRNEEFEDQIKEISGTVGVLDKLSKTDKELLQKYSRTYFLNENFIPLKLTKIDDKYVLAGKKEQYFHGNALEFLEDLLNEAKEDGIELKIVSAYRSFDEQVELKGQYTQVYGSGANSFSADQGYSEHQLGTTVDLTDPITGGTYTSFTTTEAYTWLLDNAYKYGFILSYPQENGFYIFEPWHWRFVGRDLARDLHEDNAHFHDWDQRKLNEYLVKIFD